jgi:hypothetical protein
MLFEDAPFRLAIRLKVRWWLLLLGIAGGYGLVYASLGPKLLPGWLAAVLICVWMTIFLGDLFVNYRMKLAWLRVGYEELELRTWGQRVVYPIEGMTGELGLHYVDESMVKIEGTVCYLHFANGSEPLAILGDGVELELSEYTAPDTYGDQVHWLIRTRGVANFQFEQLMLHLNQADVKFGASTEAGSQVPQ